MQAIAVALLAVLAVASAGLIAAPVGVVHSVPIVHAAPVVRTVQVVQPAVVHKTLVPVSQSSSFSYRAPAAKLVVPVVHHAPLIRAVPVVHSAPVLLH